jgi:hypothetical protein
MTWAVCPQGCVVPQGTQKCVHSVAAATPATAIKAPELRRRKPDAHLGAVER